MAARVASNDERCRRGHAGSQRRPPERTTSSLFGGALSRSGDLRSFELVIDADDFCLHNDLKHGNFTSTPNGLVADVFFCSTPAENSDLEISEVEIFQPDAD